MSIGMMIFTYVEFLRTPVYMLVHFSLQMQFDMCHT